MPKKLASLVCLLTLGLSLTTSVARAHKFEDGFVERTMAIIVRDKTATVEYSVGLNATTLQNVLKEWDRESQDPRPATSNAAKSNSDSESAHQIDAELLKRFKKIATKEIVERIDVSCDGQPMVPKSVTLGPAPLHPFVLTIKFEFQLPVSNDVDLKVADRNFLGQTGAVRYALKAKGNSMLLKSNQEPILVRAERVELADLTAAERAKWTGISARLAIIDKRPSEKRP